MQSETTSKRRSLEERKGLPLQNERVAAASGTTETNDSAHGSPLGISSVGDMIATDVDPRAVDVLLATELKQLSVLDREAVHEVGKQPIFLSWPAYFVF
jgi:hypothetical protein